MRLRVARKVMYGPEPTSPRQLSRLFERRRLGTPWRESTFDRALARLRKVRRLRRRQAINRGLHPGESCERSGR